ncbi:MAG: carbon-nitrogen hydrolase family protein [Candidatus Hodarchaeales archaeon]
MNKRKLVVALAQVQSVQANIEKNMAIINSECVKASKENADIVIFPELSVTGYLMHDEVVNLASKIPEGDPIKSLEKIASEHGIHVVAGLPEEDAAVKGIYYNTAVIVGPDGYSGKYRKILLPNHSVFNEKRYFKPATMINSIDTSLARIGLCICYDLFSPEISRYHALNGCELIICISASPGVRQKYFETFTQARAMENSVYIIYVNQAGIQDNLIFWGGSEIIAPTGKRVLKLDYDIPAFGTAEIDLQRIKTNRTFVPTLRDNANWLYGDLEEASWRI